MSGADETPGAQQEPPMTTITRLDVATAIAAAIGGKAWASTPDAQGNFRVRVYPSGRGGFIAVQKRDGGFGLRYDGGMNDGVATRCIRAGVVVSTACDTVTAEFLATVQPA